MGTYRGSIVWIVKTVVLADRAKWFVILIPVLLARCVTPKESGKSVAGVEEESGRIVLTGEDNGRSLTVHEGRIVEIRLDENPTTGYRWGEYEMGGDVIGLRGTKFVLAEKPLIGQGGTRIFTYEARNPGQSHIKLRHWQQWEGEGSVTERFEVAVTVTAQSAP